MVKMITTSPFKAALSIGTAQGDEVITASTKVADLMKSLHGGDWKIAIDHQRQAVMIFNQA